MTRSFEFHPLAAREARKAYRWYAVRSPHAAAKFIAELDRAVAKVAQFPDRHSTHLAGTHVYQLRKFPYHIIYCVRDESITVIAVAHGKQRRGYWKRRLRDA